MNALMEIQTEASTDNAAAATKQVGTTLAKTPDAAIENFPTITTSAVSAIPSTSSLTTVEGIGRDIEPRNRLLEADPVDAEEKQDLAGFNVALPFAVGALMTSPGVQPGTDVEGSGVGAIVELRSDSAAATDAVRLGNGRRKAYLLLLYTRSGLLMSKVASSFASHYG